MGAVNQLLSGTGLQVSASNTSNNMNVNNLPGSKLMARKRSEEYEDDEQYAGDKYIKQNDMDDLEDDDYSMSDGEYEENEEVREESEPDMSENTYDDDYSSDDNGGYEEDYASASADGELGLRSGEDTVTYQINTEQQQNQLRPASSGNMDMYIGTSNLYSDLVGLKPETFRSESMDNEFDANDYIGFSPEGSVLPSVRSESVVGSFTGDDGIFGTFAPNNENSFVPSLDGTLGFDGVQQDEESSFIPSLDGVFGFGGGQEEKEESPFVPSVAGAIGLGLGIGIGSALGVPTTMFNNPMNNGVPVSPDFNENRNTKYIPHPALRKPTEKTDGVVVSPENGNDIVDEMLPEEFDDITTVEQTVPIQNDKSNSHDKKGDALKNYNEVMKRINKHKADASERKIENYERSARELTSKNELSTNQYEAARVAKEHSNDMANLRRQNQLAELQHAVAMRAKDKEMLDMMRNENIDAIKYDIEMQNRGRQSVPQNEMMPYPPYQGDDDVIGSGLGDILGVGSNYDYGMGAVGMGMSLGESLGVSNGFGGMGSSLDESLGFVRYDDAPITMNAFDMQNIQKWKDRAKRGYNAFKSGTKKAGSVISDVGSTLYDTRTAIINKTNPYRDAYSKALEEKNAIKERELTAKQALRDKQAEIRNTNAMRAQEAREIRQARQLADMQHRIAMEAQRQELAQMRADAYDAQNMRNMMTDVGQALPNQGLSLGVSNGGGGVGGLSLGVDNSVGGFSGVGLGDSLGLPSVRAQQPLQPQMAVAPTNPSVQYKTEAEKYPYSNSPRLTSSVDDDGYSYSGRGYHSSLFSEVMGEIKPIKKARKSSVKKTKKANKNKVKRVKKVSKVKTR